MKKVFITILLIILIIALIILGAFIYNNQKFVKILKENGYSSSNDLRFVKNEKEIGYEILITKKHIFSMPEFTFTKLNQSASKTEKDPESGSEYTSIHTYNTVINFYDIYDESKNLIMPGTEHPTNICTSTIALPELEKELEKERENYSADFLYSPYFKALEAAEPTIEFSEGFSTAYISKELWKEVSKEHVENLRNTYNEVVNMFK